MRKTQDNTGIAEIRSIGEIVSDLKEAISHSGYSDSEVIASSIAELDEYVLSSKVVGRTRLRLFGILVLLLLTAIVGMFLMVDRNDALQSKILVLESRESFFHSRDSLYGILLGVDSTQTIVYQVRDSIPVSYPELVLERDSIRTRYYDVLDEKERYRVKLEMITQNYPIKIMEEGNYYVLHAERIDSAMMLLDLYRDRIRYDAEKSVWIVER